MATKAKNLSEISKHLTRAEIAARSSAEASTLPTRPYTATDRPASISKDRLACHYWDQAISRMSGADIEILDDLDADTLACYCSILSRRDRLNYLCSELINSSMNNKKYTATERLEMTNRLDSLTSKLSSLERNILAYADKLGMTPGGRTGLAKRKAQAEVAEENNDLFGD